MRPITLTMAGLRSYRTLRTIEFGAPGLVAVIGDTGAGKSSILEGITGALYGSCTWDGTGLGELISDGVQTLQLELTFAVAGQTWTVSRSASRKYYPPAKHHLRCHDTGEVLDGERVVTARIAGLLGLDRKQFLRVVVLPQNRFMELLNAAHAERNSILKGIFRLDDLDQVRQAAEVLLAEWDPKLVDARLARRRLADDPTVTLDDAQTRRARADTDKDRLKNIRDTITAHVNAEKAAGDAAGQLRGSRQRLTEAKDAAGDISAILTAAEDAATELDAGGVRLAAERAQLTERLTAAQAALDAAAAAGEDAATLATAATVLHDLTAAVPTLIADRHGMDEDDSRLARQVADLDGLRAQNELKAAELAAATAALKPLADQAEQAAQTRDGAKSLLGTLAEALAAATNNAVVVGERRETLTAARAKARQRAEEFTRAAAATAAAEHDLQQLHRRNAAAHAAAGCAPGDECPVCARPLPESFVPPLIPEIDKAAQTVTKLRQTTERLNRTASVDAERARQAATDLATAIDEQVNRLRALADATNAVKTISTSPTFGTSQLPLLLAGCDTASVHAELAASTADESDIIRAAAGDLASTPALDKPQTLPAARVATTHLVEQVSAVIDRGIDELAAPLIAHADQLRHRCEQARADRDALGRTVVELDAQLRGQTHMVNTVRSALASRRDRLITDAIRIAQQVVTLPRSCAAVVSAAGITGVPTAGLAPTLSSLQHQESAGVGTRTPELLTVALPQTDTATFTATASTIAAQLDKARTALDNRESELRTARDGLEQLDAKQKDLADRRTQTVGQPVNRAAAGLQKILTRAGDLHATLAAVAADALDGTDFPGLGDAAAPDPAMTADTISAYRSSTTAVLAAVDAVGDAAGRAIDVLTRRAATERQAVTRVLADQALPDLAALKRAERDADTTWELADREVRRARAEIPVAAALDAGIAELSMVLNVLLELRKALGSSRFVSFVIARRANALLLVASKVLNQLTGGGFSFAEDFRIIDRRTNTERGVKTLSGGENFLASLSLALALVELAGRGGGRIESLFLDEGFGSLDAAILTEALDVLRDHVSTGRLVTIISHLHAVAADLDRVLLITKTPSGSDPRWLEATERDRLLIDDVSAGLVT